MKNVFQILAIGSLLQSILSPVNAQDTASANQNYVIVNTVKTAGVITEAQVKALSFTYQQKIQTITYFDGLGYPIQEIKTHGSASEKDIITPFEYDAFGREAKKFLPYTYHNGTDRGLFDTGWKSHQASFYGGGTLQGVDTSLAPYSQIIFEPSPVNRVLAQGSPGVTWQPNLNDPYDANARVLKIKYEVNTVFDSVRIFYLDSSGAISTTGFFNTGLLSIKTSIDEHNGIVKEFTDKGGHLILKRVFIDSDSLQTYYVYDDFNLLRAVLQPEGVAAITGSSWTATNDFVGKWIFLYRYDGHNRTVMKKMPGADSVLMVYDQWDRLVLTQDGNLRNQNRWLFNKYDALNRVIVTGSIIDTRSQTTIRAYIDTTSARYESVNTSADEGYTLTNTFPSSSDYTLALFTITHYDSYSNLPSWASNYPFVSEHGVSGHNDNVQGQVVGTQIKILTGNTWLRGTVYYDDKYRVIQNINDNNVGGKDRVTKIWTFDGLNTNEYQAHTHSFFSDTITTSRSYGLLPYGQVQVLDHKIGSHEDIRLQSKTYNELLQVISKTIHHPFSQSKTLQKLDYSYNIRGWLNGINQPYGDGTGYDESDLFNFALHYNTTNLSGATAQYNGNIAEQVWKGGYDEYLRGYKYSYDKANRLLEANYAFKYVNFYNDTVWDFTHRYDEKIDQYDRNGNIKQLERYHNAWNKVDELHYSGWDGNKLLRVDDWVFSNLPVGFHDGNSWIDDYRYDQNGNMTFDFNKSIDSIHYNHLNLPDTITVYGKGGIRYLYDAAGNKLQKTVTDTTGGSTKITTYKYAGAFVYKNDTLELVNYDEGRIRPLKIDTTQAFSPSNVRYTYDYFLKDHLGNVRMVLSTEQQTDLYAATMETAAATKEEQLFGSLGSTRTVKPSGFDTDGSNDQVARLNGDINTSGNHRVGPSLVIKVMAGDTISLATRAWYSGSTQTPPSGLTPIADEIVSLLTNSVVAAGGTHGGNVSSSDIGDGVGSVVSDFLDNAQPYDNSKPKAFLNWMIVDEEFKKVTATYHRGAVQVPTIGGGDTAQLLVGPSNMVVRRGGWLYVYLSNESNQNVYFDNLTVSHKRGPVMEVNDYYPFGLQIPGISSQAQLNNQYSVNRYKFNDKELDADLGINTYQFKFRTMDPLIGRFAEIDPLADRYVYNSTYAYAENDVTNSIDLEGAEGGPVRYMESSMYEDYRRSYREINSYVPRATSYRNSGIYIPNQAAGSAPKPADIYEPFEPGTGAQHVGPFIMRGNPEAKAWNSAFDLAGALKDQIESVTITTDHVLSNDKMQINSPQATIKWSSQEASDIFNTFQKLYDKAKADIINSHPIPAPPGKGASKEDWQKWFSETSETVSTVNALIVLLGPSPTDQVIAMSLDPNQSKNVGSAVEALPSVGVKDN